MKKVYNEHFDALEKQTGQEGVELYWEGKQSKTRERYDKLREFLQGRSATETAHSMDSARLTPPD